MASKEDETFIGRWSRRKREGEAEAERAVVPRNAQEATNAAEPEPEFDPATLPKIEEMTASSDFSVFLQKGVPEFLKRQALRHAWSIDPAIRDFMEVAENQWNFNDPNGVPGFGELAAGTDIKALLAQAIGERPKVEVAGADPNDCDTVPAAETIASSQAPMPPGVVEDAAVSEPGSEPSHMLVSAIDGPPTEDPPTPHRAGRRRHGGALPDVEHGT